MFNLGLAPSGRLRPCASQRLNRAAHAIVVRADLPKLVRSVTTRRIAS